MLRKKHETVSCNPPGGGGGYGEALSRGPTPYLFHEKGTLFVCLLLTNGTPFALSFK